MELNKSHVCHVVFKPALLELNMCVMYSIDLNILADVIRVAGGCSR